MKVTVRFTLDVPDGTDPQKVLEEAQKSIDSEVGHGGLWQWGDWDVGDAELAGDVWIVLIEDMDDQLEALPFSSEELAAGFARAKAGHDGVTGEELPESTRAAGWVLVLPMCEDDHRIGVLKRTVDAARLPARVAAPELCHQAPPRV